MGHVPSDVYSSAVLFHHIGRAPRPLAEVVWREGDCAGHAYCLALCGCGGSGLPLSTVLVILSMGTLVPRELAPSPIGQFLATCLSLKTFLLFPKE